jgi:beta-N-acetylhexosaminidase
VLDHRDLETISQTDLRPFAALLPRLDSLMMAHVVYAAVDDRPAGYSPVWLQDLLRGELDYRGVVFSDDLGMQAARGVGGLVKRARAALEAGCDAVLTCKPEDTRELLESLGDDLLTRCPGLTSLAGKGSLTESELEMVSEWRHWRRSIADLATSRWA